VLTEKEQVLDVIVFQVYLKNKLATTAIENIKVLNLRQNTHFKLLYFSILQLIAQFNFTTNYLIF